MNAGEIYSRVFSTADVATVQKLKAIFTTEIGATTVDIEDDTTSFYIYNESEHKCGFKVTVTEKADTAGIIKIILVVGGIEKVSTIFSASTSSPCIVFSYGKKDGNSFMFGLNVCVESASSTMPPILYVMSSATKFNDSTLKEPVAIFQYTVSSNTAIVCGTTYTTTAYRYDTDNGFIQLSRLATGTGKYVCDDLYVPCYGGNGMCGQYVIDNCKYIATGRNTSQTSITQQSIFLKTE